MLKVFKPANQTPSPGFTVSARLLVVYTLLVILWGAWVRISHSGDGCGESWPLCHGVVLPDAAAPTKTWIELAHRIQSGLFGIFVVALVLFARKAFAQAHPVRFWVKASLFFTITEALLGAKLVLFGLVGQNSSAFRAFAMSLHFANSVLLVISLTLVALFCTRQEWFIRTNADQLLSNRLLRKLPRIAGLIFLLLGITGAIAALSTTLFPTLSLAQGFLADFHPDSHFLLKLRTFHPVMGILGGFGLIALFYSVGEKTPAEEVDFRKRCWNVIIVAAVTICIGMITLFWLSPIPLKIIHLFLAHALGIALTGWWQSLRFKMIESNN